MKYFWNVFMYIILIYILYFVNKEEKDIQL